MSLRAINSLGGDPWPAHAFLCSAKARGLAVWSYEPWLFKRGQAFGITDKIFDEWGRAYPPSKYLSVVPPKRCECP